MQYLLWWTRVGGGIAWRLVGHRLEGGKLTGGHINRRRTEALSAWYNKARRWIRIN